MDLMIVRSRGAANSKRLIDFCMKNAYVSFLGAVNEMEKGMICLFLTGDLGQLTHLKAALSTSSATAGLATSIALITNSGSDYRSRVVSYF